MTNQEAIAWIKSIKDKYIHGGDDDFDEKRKKSLDIAIKALEQQNKRGHWIRVTDEAGYLVWECDKCGWQQRFNTNFCSDCGAKMEE